MSKALLTEKKPHQTRNPFSLDKFSEAHRAVLVGTIRIVDYLEHGRTFANQRANAGT